MEIKESDYRELGRTGIKVSPFAIGCWEFGGPPHYPDQDDRESIGVIRTAIEMGVNFFDTAELYGNGHSEEILGEAVHQSGKEVVIMTKIATSSKDEAEFRVDSARVVKSVEGSLRRLGRETIDLCLFHWPSRDIIMDDAMDALMKLKKKGTIRAIGVSNFQLDELMTASEYGEIDVVQSPYSLLWRCLEDDLFSYCTHSGISMLAYSPLANGMLTNAFLGGGRRPKSDTQNWLVLFKESYFELVQPVLDAAEGIARGKDCTISQVALAWLLSKSNVDSMIMGVESLQQFTDNMQAILVMLSVDDINILENAGEPLKKLTESSAKRSMTNWWPDKDKG